MCSLSCDIFVFMVEVIFSDFFYISFCIQKVTCFGEKCIHSCVAVWTSELSNQGHGCTGTASW